jgi:HrpA-like RNA helicase
LLINIYKYRTAPGKAYRLYSEDSFDKLLPDTIPEIQRSSLLSTVLSLKKMNIVDVLNFEFIDPPDETLVRNALKHLYLLGGIDDDGKITPLGDKMSHFPLSPSLSRVLIASAEEFDCSYEAVIIVSIMAGETDLFRSISPRSKGGEAEMMEADECRAKLAHHTGDHMTYLNIWNEWRHYDKDRKWCKSNYINPKVLETAANVREQLMDVMDKLKLKIKRAPTIQRKLKSSGKSRRRAGEIKLGVSSDPVPILKSFLAGYFTNIANKAAHRAVFSHYSPDEHLSVDSSATIKSTALVALYLNPQCALTGFLERTKSQYSEVDWVLYSHVTFTTKAIMKGVSKILWDWVKSEEGQARIKKLPHARLNGEARPTVENMDTEAEEKLAEEKEKELELEQIETKKRRAEEIESIRQRALARRKM